MNDYDDQLQRFINGYIDAILWTGFTISEDGTFESDDLREAAGLLTTESLKEITADCSDFLNCAIHLMVGLDAYDCGIDFALTRNGHGTGFWDRGLGAIGEELASLSRPYGASNAYYMANTHQVVVEA
jgi:hypothetical protein